jgi:hypothetical protein
MALLRAAAIAPKSDGQKRALARPRPQGDNSGERE